VIGQVILIILIGLFGALELFPLDAPEGTGRWFGTVAGTLVIVLGAAEVALGASELGPHLTAVPRPRHDGELVEHGIYRLVRHPIYAGVMQLGIGWAAFTGSAPAFAAALALVVWLDLKARREEAWLADHYPGYAAYRARTARFVPRLY
jgi:protein-S-isoprenylcysteine O-methyltransferase Ste14